METLDSYVEVLENQSSLFAELLELAKAKQPILINGEIEQLDDLVKKEQKIIIQVGRLEEKRNSLHQALANHFCVRSEELSAAKLVTLLDDEYQNKMQIINEDLLKTLSDLEKLNNENTNLLEQSLEFVNFSLNLLTGISNEPVYGENEDKTNRTVTKIFDRKI